MRKIIKRTFVIVLFLCILFSPIIFIEILLYTIRYIFTGIKFPKSPLSFTVLNNLW